MPTATNKRTKVIADIEKLLGEHFPDSPGQYPPKAYRYNVASIRVRVVNPRFQNKNESERYKMVAPILKKNLPEDTWQDITILLLLAPAEVDESLMNQEFEHPTPSRL